MPRIRTVKPEFWSHPVMGRASDGAKCLALALLNWADDEGYFQADPALVRNFARPLDTTPDTTLILLEEVFGTEWIEVRRHPLYGLIGWVVKFKLHQVVNHPRKSSLRPYFEAPDSLPEAYGNATLTQGVKVALPDDYRNITTGKGREGKGKEGKNSNAHAREEKPAAAVVADAWSPEILDQLRTAFGVTEFTSQDFASFLVSALKFPQAQRENAALAFLTQGKATEGKGYGYLLRMIEGGASVRPEHRAGAANLTDLPTDYGPAGRRIL